MERSQQLAFCRKCQNRKMDVRQGLVCGLTSQKATFEGACSSFKEDVIATKKLVEKERTTQLNTEYNAVSNRTIIMGAIFIIKLLVLLSSLWGR